MSDLAVMLVGAQREASVRETHLVLNAPPYKLCPTTAYTAKKKKKINTTFPIKPTARPIDVIIACVYTDGYLSVNRLYHGHRRTVKSNSCTSLQQAYPYACKKSETSQNTEYSQRPEH